VTVRIGTRGSDLALWQAHWVQSQLAPVTETELVIIKTKGDTIDTKPLSKVEGKAFFTAEIERALLDDEVDLAVHSHKDLETACDPALRVVAVPARGLVQERLLVASEAHDPTAPLLPLKSGAKVGTSAPRRRIQLLALRPDLELAELRGNVPTRVQRLREGRYDAVLLAAAGLERLELDTTGLVAIDLEPELLVPSPAQGALAIQIRAADTELAATLGRVMHDDATAEAVAAERWLLLQAGGGCHVPLGALVQPLLDAEGAPAGQRCLFFLGQGHPQEGDASRWVEARGDDPQAAAEAAWDRVMSGKPTGAGPLSGLVTSLVGSAEGGSGLGARLEQLGATVRHEKVLDFRAVKAPELPAKLARLKPGDVLAVTSQEAARRLSGHRVPSGVAIAAVGPGTAHALSASGLRPTLVGKGGARALASRIEVGEGGHVLFPCALEARPELPDALRERGIEVDRIVLYRTVAAEETDVVEGADVVIYMSPSSVATAVGQGRETRRQRVVRIGLGGSTCDALQDEGLDHERPHGSGPEAAVALLCQLFDPARRKSAPS
jgi:hydroxymethylbilane synthase